MRLSIGLLALLLASNAANEGRFLDVAGSRLYYEECGSGPPVVLLHDGLAHSVTWDFVWPLLCKGHRVLRYDRRGMGRSDPPKAPFIPAEDLHALLADRKIASATLVGSSSGAGLALDYAFRHPAEVERLVLVGPVVHGMASSDHFTARGARNSAPLSRGDVRAAARNWADDRYQLGPGSAAARRFLFRTLAANPQDLLYKGDLELRFAVPAAARMGEVRAPALILVGEHDIPDVQAYAGAIELGVWGSRREVVSGAGHLVQLEKPEWLAAAIERFIQETPAAVAPETELQACAGTYANLMYGRPGQFLVESGRLVLRVPTERDLPLFPAGGAAFYAIVRGGLRFEFVKDEAGTVTGVDVAEGAQVRRSARTP